MVRNCWQCQKKIGSNKLNQKEIEKYGYFCSKRCRKAFDKKGKRDGKQIEDMVKMVRKKLNKICVLDGKPLHWEHLIIYQDRRDFEFCG